MFMWHLNQLICTYYFKYPSSTGNRIRSIPQNMKWKAIRTYTIDKKFKKKKRKGNATTTRPNEHICKPLVCMKSVSVLPSTGESSSDPKSATCHKKMVVKNKHCFRNSTIA